MRGGWTFEFTGKASNMSMTSWIAWARHEFPDVTFRWWPHCHHCYIRLWLPFINLCNSQSHRHEKQKFRIWL